MANNELQPEMLAGPSYPTTVSSSVPPINLTTPDSTLSGVSRGTQTYISSDGSKMLLGNLPNNEFGIAFYNSQGILIRKWVGPTGYIYDPANSSVNILRDGKLPDGSYGLITAKPGIDVSTLFS